MATTESCAKCGAVLKSDALGGLCPKCVAPLAFAPGFDPPAAPPPATPGVFTPELALHSRRFGDYELLEEIARGGMGVVFKARQITLNRTVAVKMILAGQLASPGEVQRFRTEAEAAASLQHPNIVAVHEVGQHDGQYYFSMDYVEGKSLAQLIAEFGARSAESSSPGGEGRSEGVSNVQWLRRAAGYVKTIAEAIHYAHQHGTLHRDLKPSNVLIDQFDQPRITDFGLAKRLTDSQLSTLDSQLTLTGQVLGTPSFLPPEQATGQRGTVGPHSDVYSLGAILYFLLTKRPPFAGETIQETLVKVSSAEPVRARKLNPAVPRDLETICLKCLEKEPRRRFATAQELADELARFLRDEPILARPASRVEKAWRWCRRHPAVASLGLSLAITLTLLLVVIALVAQRRQQSEFARRSGPAAAAASNRSSVAPIPVLSGRGASAVIDGILYVSSPSDGYGDEPGNRNWFHAYDPFKNQWSKLPGTPTIHLSPASGVPDGKFYVVGGTDEKGALNPQLDVYFPASNSWSVGAPMPTARLGAAGAVLNHRLYVLGGTDGTNVLSKVEIYDPATGGWTRGPEMPTPRTGPSAVVLNGTLYVLGGLGPSGQPSPSDPRGVPLATMDALTREGTWESKRPMQVAVSEPFAAAIEDTLYVAGGDAAEAETPVLQAYRADAGRWNITRAAMPEGRVRGCGAQVIAGLLYVIGGWTSAPNPPSWNRYSLPHDDVFVYDPRLNVWGTDSILITNAAWEGRIAPSPLLTGCGVSGVIDGKLYVTSPCDGQPGHRNHFHFYAPLENDWSHALPATPAVHNSGAGGVVDGKFYLAGGRNSKGVIHGQLDVYDPATNVWSTAASMPAPRWHTAGAVLNGKLYVLGGAEATNLSTVVEVYDPKANRWATGPALPSPREELGAAVVNRTLYVVGGKDPAGQPSDSVHALNAKGRWIGEKRMPVAVSGAFVSGLDGILYVAGGLSATGEVNLVQAYIGAKNRWEMRAPLPEARQSGSGAQPLDGQLYVVGGWSGQPASLHDDVFAYDPRRNVWRR